MVKGIIKNTYIILSKITKFIWFLSYCNFSKIDMYFETEGVLFIKHLIALFFHTNNISFINAFKTFPSILPQ